MLQLVRYYHKNNINSLVPLMDHNLIEYPILSELSADVNPYKTYGLQQYLFNPWDVRREVWLEKQNCDFLDDYFFKLPFARFYSYKVSEIQYMKITFDISVSNYAELSELNKKKIVKNLHMHYELYKYFWSSIKSIISSKICAPYDNELTKINQENSQNATQITQVVETTLSHKKMGEKSCYRFIHV